ncbi:MAG: hypothetical protein A2W91_07050 [Bacteroidetes bacterium GWF2_38_335]|nr:MAG: hypothetical protein A2W91_07050 [Bacteroidetes bacterium GWF2_38_335]OFY77085.1 MAG: hypothetical protein A2281_14285 [Bacteroidetes bacterium RIFOXYA12_FULL_38_20]HBS84975.1 hypothetical protein [Bacteroidales bacterium]
MFLFTPTKYSVEGCSTKIFDAFSTFKNLVSRIKSRKGRIFNEIKKGFGQKIHPAHLRGRALPSSGGDGGGLPPAKPFPEESCKSPPPG